MHHKKLSLILLALFLALFVAGCKKKVPPPPPPPPEPVKQEAPPKPASPIVSEFIAEPSSIEKGGAVTLRWNTQNATDVSIDQGVGSVPASGTRQVFPNDSTTYMLTARGPGGDASRTARVTVTSPPPPRPKPETAKASFEDVLSSRVQDIYFDYDSSAVREDQRGVLTSNADALKALFDQFPGRQVVVEGHCDERGSAEYNLALGDRRATATRDFLVQLGVDGGRLSIISYGEERPQCFENNESCYQRNRRSHFAAGR